MTPSPRLAPDQRARLQRLHDQGVLTHEQLTAVLGELERGRDVPASGGLWEVLGYIGGALVLGGATLLVGMSWDVLSRPTRVGLLLAATVVLALAGLVLAGGPRELRNLPNREPSARSRIVSVLFGLASGTAALAAGSGADDGLLAAATGLIAALLGYAVVRGLVVLLTAAAFSVGTVISATDKWFSTSTLSLTIGLVALGALWAALAATGVLRYRHAMIGAGVLIMLAGSQCPLGTHQPWWGYSLTLLIALLCFGAYLIERAAALLALGVLGVTVAVPEAVWDWTGCALSGPLTVLLVGVVFLAASGIGWRLRKTSVLE